MTRGGKKALLALGLLAGTGVVAAVAYSMATSDEKKKEATLPPPTDSGGGAPPPTGGGGNSSSSYPFNPFNPYGTGYELGKKILGKG